jgi:hypothetical protein
MRILKREEIPLTGRSTRPKPCSTRTLRANPTPASLRASAERRFARILGKAWDPLSMSTWK